MKNLLLLAWLFTSANCFAQFYYGAGEAVNLENQIGFDKHQQKIITGSSATPTLTATYGSAGSLFLQTTGSCYLKQDAGTTANWLKLGTSDDLALKADISYVDATATLLRGETALKADLSYVDATVTLKADKSYVDFQDNAGLSYTDATATLLWAEVVTKEPIIAPGTIAQYWRGDKTWVDLPIVSATMTGTSPLVVTGGGDAVLQDINISLEYTPENTASKTDILTDDSIQYPTTHAVTEALLTKQTATLTSNSTWIGNTSNVASETPFRLSSLKDVSLINPGSPQVLTYNGSEWNNALVSQSTGTWMNWYEVTGTNTNVTMGSGYVVSTTATATFNLPHDCTFGDEFHVIGNTATYSPWSVSSNATATQEMHYLDESSGATDGTSSQTLWRSLNPYDTAEFQCTSTGTKWTVKNAIGGELQTVGVSGIPFPSSVIAYYKMDETSGNGADSRNSYTLTLNGSLTTVTGKFSNARNGWGTSSNYLYSTNSVYALAINQKWAMDFFIKFENPPATGDQLPLMEIGGDASQTYQLGVHNQGGTNYLGMDFYANYYGLRYCLYNINSFYGDGLYHHVVALWDRDTGNPTGTLYMTLYVDGTQVASTNATNTQSVFTSALRIGIYQTSVGYPAGASFDDIAIWKGTLPTATDITNRYNSGAGKQYQ